MRVCRASVLLFAVGACSTIPGADKSFPEIAQVAVTARSDAFVRADIDALADLYTEDAIVLPPGRPALRGRDEIKAFWSTAIDDGRARLRLELVEHCQETEDFAWVTGRYSLVSEALDVTGSGTYLAVWVHTDRGWRCQLDMWNRDALDPSAATR